MKNILLYLIAGTRGGFNRARIINALDKRPSNIHKLSKDLKLDYKTVQHHIDILEKNMVLSVVKKGSYGAVYILSEEMNLNMDVFTDIWNRFG